MNRRILIVFFITLTSIALFAQSNDYIDDILDSETITVADTAYLIYMSKDPAAEDGGLEAAIELMSKTYNLNPSAATRAVDISALCMNEYQLPKGLMYSITKAPRYAYRDMQFGGYLKGITDPSKALTPEEALRIISECQSEWSNTQ